jgi:hypothetical protein
VPFAPSNEFMSPAGCSQTRDYGPSETEAAGVLPDCGIRTVGRKEFAWERVDATDELQAKAKRV